MEGWDKELGREIPGIVWNYSCTTAENSNLLTSLDSASSWPSSPTLPLINTTLNEKIWTNSNPNPNSINKTSIIKHIIVKLNKTSIIKHIIVKLNKKKKKKSNYLTF